MSSETMTSKERMRRTLRFQKPDRAPRDLWTLPGVKMFNQGELRAMLERYPLDIDHPQMAACYGRAEKARGSPGRVGDYVDEWGCGWSVAEPGVIGEVKKPPLAQWRSLDHLQPPWEILKGADLSSAHKLCAESEPFIVADTTVRPFERMQFLRGSEQLFIDLAYGEAEVLQLRDLVHEFFLREIEMWAETDVDAISFMDDWGMQRSLLISLPMWREIFKPLYADYCRLIHDAGKFAFMHSDGNIEAIYADLIEIGVDVLNSQLFCMDIELLGHRYQGQITFWGEIDRQQVLPFGTPEQVKEAVRRVRRVLDKGTGGVIAQCEWGNDVPARNIAAVFEAWMEPMP
ncbi:MAG: uroporphyrinogen decarboxylase family protein [Chloroflexota bacterium]|nr:uroporphyrinogen decarboxylase family protein [Chloroflexota bacterium]